MDFGILNGSPTEEVSFANAMTNSCEIFLDINPLVSRIVVDLIVEDSQGSVEGSKIIW